MMRFEKRLRALEARLIANPVVLHLPDGSTREICGRGDYLMDLFFGAGGHVDLTCGQAADLDLIRQCVRSKEPDGGRMIELIQAFLLGPVEESGNV
jgi:hypothetical protein